MKIEYCPTCDNMLYMQSDARVLELHCRYCRFSRPLAADELKRPIHTTDMATEDDALVHRFCNPNIKYDRTLPRVTDVQCPQPGCEGGEVIVSRYDDVNLRYMFFCTACEKFWQ